MTSNFIEPGSYFDYYETVILLCRYPGCAWEQEAGWDDMEQDPPEVFSRHFNAVHAGKENETS